jgi:hypothetical protein
MKDDSPYLGDYPVLDFSRCGNVPYSTVLAGLILICTLSFSEVVHADGLGNQGFGPTNMPMTPGPSLNGNAPSLARNAAVRPTLRSADVSAAAATFFSPKSIIIKTPFCSTEPRVSPVILTSQLASTRADWICEESAQASPDCLYSVISSRWPLKAVRSLIRESRCSSVRIRGLIFSCSSNKARSALAARSSATFPSWEEKYHANDPEMAANTVNPTVAMPVQYDHSSNDGKVIPLSECLAMAKRVAHSSLRISSEPASATTGSASCYGRPKNVFVHAVVIAELEFRHIKAGGSEERQKQLNWAVHEAEKECTA